MRTRRIVETVGCLFRLEDCAVLASLVDRNGLAVQIAAAAAASRERLSLIRPPHSEMRWQRQVDALRTAMGGESFQAAWHGARQTGIEEAIQLAQQGFKGLT